MATTSDHAPSVPTLHEALAGRMVELLRTEGIGPDERIPSGRELQSRFGVSRETVARAVDALVRDGLLYRRRGRGIFLARAVDAPAAGTVALLFGKGFDLFADPIWAEPHAAILQSLQAGGHEISVNLMDDHFRHGTFLDELRRKRPAGLIMTANVHAQIATNAAAYIPVVGVRDAPDGLEILWSTCDNRAAAKLSVEHLAGLGHRRIGYAGDMKSVRAGPERLEGQREALQRRGLPFPRRLISGDRPLSETDRFCLEARLRPYGIRRDFLDGPDRPTAVICVSIGHTDNLIALAREKGINIPRDLSVISLVDCPAYAVPGNASVTVVQTMSRALGDNAVRLLREAASGHAPESGTLRGAPEMRTRASTAMPPRLP